MEDYFGEEVAAGYDDDNPISSDEVVGPTVEFLADLACDGLALELGIGTGRIAVPLAWRGVGVHGIDLSEAMVARLREKPGSEEIDVTIGDFATTRIKGTFRLAYLVFNTIMNLTTQEAQVASFETSHSTSSGAGTSSSKSWFPISAGFHPASGTSRST